MLPLCVRGLLSMKTMDLESNDACRKGSVHASGGVGGLARTLGTCCQLKTAPGVESSPGRWSPTVIYLPDQSKVDLV